MKFNAFNQISPAVDDVKKLIKPMKFKDWLKLGFVAMLSGNGSGGSGGGGGRGMNFNIPSGGSGKGGESLNETVNEITGSAVDSVKEKIGGLAYVIAPIIVVVFLLLVILSYIKSVFTFMFIECVETRKTSVKKYWRKNQSLGMSYFLFKILMTLLGLAILAVSALPFLIPLISMGWETYIDSLHWGMLLWALPWFLFIGIVFFVFAVFMALVFNFALPHMYFNKLPMMPSLRKVFKKINMKKVETLVFLLSKFVIGIVVGIAAVLIAVVLMIPSAIVAIPFGLIFYGLWASFGWAAGVIAGLVVVGSAFLVFFVYVFSVIFLPMSTFLWYYIIRNYKLLMK